MRKDHHLSNEIRGVRERLNEIEEERNRLPEDASGDLAGVREEEHRLRARLIQLQDETLKDWDTVELPGIPG